MDFFFPFSALYSLRVYSKCDETKQMSVVLLCSLCMFLLTTFHLCKLNVKDLFLEEKGGGKYCVIVARESIPNYTHHSVLLGSQGQQSQ